MNTDREEMQTERRSKRDAPRGGEQTGASAADRVQTQETRTDNQRGTPALRVMRMEEMHIPAVAEIERMCFPQPWSEQALCLFLGEQGVGYVAVDGGDGVIAYAGMLLAPGEGQIASIAVRPDFRRAGRGRAVLRALIADARERGLGQLSLEVRESNSAARSLYLGEGFAEAGIRRHFYSHPREDAVVMLLALG